MNLNHLVVAIYARAAMDRKETGTGNLSWPQSKIKNNIVHGRAVDPVEGIPAEYVPDWAAWQQYYEQVGVDEFVGEWVAMCGRMADVSRELASMWEAKDYDGMVRLMTEYTPMPLEGGNE